MSENVEPSNYLPSVLPSPSLGNLQKSFFVTVGLGANPSADEAAQSKKRTLQKAAPATPLTASSSHSNVNSSSAHPRPSISNITKTPTIQVSSSSSAAAAVSASSRRTMKFLPSSSASSVATRSNTKSAVSNSNSANNKESNENIEIIEGHDFNAAPMPISSSNEIDELLKSIQQTHLATIIAIGPNSSTNSSVLVSVQSSIDWLQQIHHLIGIRRILYSQPDKFIGHFAAVLRSLICSLDSLRSGLVKASLMVLHELLTKLQLNNSSTNNGSSASHSLIYNDFKKNINKELILILLRRNVEGEKFLHALALNNMNLIIQYYSSNKVISSLSSLYDHKNKSLRLFVSLFLSKSLKNIKNANGLANISELLPELLKSLYQYRNDALIETKQSAAVILSMIAMKFSDLQLSAALKKLDHKKSTELSVILKNETGNNIAAAAGVESANNTGNEDSLSGLSSNGSLTLGSRQRAKSVFSSSPYGTLRKTNKIQLNANGAKTAAGAPSAHLNGDGYSFTMPTPSSSKKLNPHSNLSNSSSGIQSMNNSPKHEIIENQPDTEAEAVLLSPSPSPNNLTSNKTHSKLIINADDEVTFQILDTANPRTDAEEEVESEQDPIRCLNFETENNNNINNNGNEIDHDGDNAATMSFSYHSRVPSNETNPQPIVANMTEIIEDAEINQLSSQSESRLSSILSSKSSDSIELSVNPSDFTSADSSIDTPRLCSPRSPNYQHASGLLDETLDDLLSKQQLEYEMIHLISPKKPIQNNQPHTNDSHSKPQPAMKESAKEKLKRKIEESQLPFLQRNNFMGNEAAAAATDSVSASASASLPSTPLVSSRSLNDEKIRRFGTPKPSLLASAMKNGANAIMNQTPKVNQKSAAGIVAEAAKAATYAAATTIIPPSITLEAIIPRPDFLQQYNSSAAAEAESDADSQYSSLQSSYDLLSSTMISLDSCKRQKLSANSVAAKQIIEIQEKIDEQLANAWKLYKIRKFNDEQSLLESMQ